MEFKKLEMRRMRRAHWRREMETRTEEILHANLPVEQRDRYVHVIVDHLDKMSGVWLYQSIENNRTLFMSQEALEQVTAPFEAISDERNELIRSLAGLPGLNRETALPKADELINMAQRLYNTIVLAPENLQGKQRFFD